MNSNEKTFQQFVDRLDIDVSVNPEHQRTLREQVLDTYHETSSDAVEIRSVWHKCIRSRLVQGSIAAMVILGALLMWMVLSSRGNEPLIVDPQPRQEEIVQPNNNLLVQDDTLQKQRINDELMLAEQLYKVGDVAGLAALFDNAATETRLAVVNYLTAIGTDEAMTVLKTLDVSQQPENVRQAVKQSIEKFETTHSADASAGTSAAETAAPETPNDNMPGRTAEQDIEKSDETPAVGAMDNADDEGGFRIVLKVLDNETNQPIADAAIRTYDGKSRDGKTDANGVYIVTRPGKGPDSINLFAAKDDYVGQSFSVGKGRFVESIPDEVVFKLVKGTVIGGVVQDGAGNPLQGATVHFSINDGDGISKAPETDVRFEQRTDKDGRWICTTAPKELTWVTIDVDHPDYAQSHVYADTAEAIEQLRAQTYVIGMDQGYAINGQVHNEAGEPIEGARIQLGRYYWYADAGYRTHTDDTGHFSFERLSVTSRTETVYEDVDGQGTVPVKHSVEFVTVSADGYAPQMMKLVFVDKSENVEFVLTPGDPLYGRVVDPNGQPVAEATVRADNWGTESYDNLCTIDWTAKTDDQGEFIWEHAPERPIQLKLTKDGYLDLETERVASSETEYEFVLNPRVRVYGQVIDAVTKEPIPAFIFRRYEGGYISSPRQVEDSEGKFTTAFADQGTTFTIAVEADGYKPTRSREISLIEQDVNLVIQMQPDTGIDGVLVDANGKPVKGVRVMIPNSWMTIDNLQIRTNEIADVPKDVTDVQGRFHLEPVASDVYGLLALDDAGYLYVSSEDFPDDGVFVLQPYAKIVGDFYKGSQPAVNERIRIDYPSYLYVNQGDSATTRLGVPFNFYTQTDEQGRFEFDRLIAGTARILIDPYRRVKLEAGQTVEVYIGGDGPTVTGQVLTPAGEPLNENLGYCSLSFQRIHEKLPFSEEELPLPDGADAMTYSELLSWLTTFGSSEEGQQWLAAMEQQYGDLSAYHSFKTDYNGQFEVPNIKPGMYLLTVEVRPWQDTEQVPRRADYNRFIAKASTVFTVPEIETAEQMDVPIDLGTLRCRTAPLAVGMQAPDFDVQNLKSSGRIRLRDYRGKTVLLNFVNPSEIDSDKMTLPEDICHQAIQRNAAVVNVAIEMGPWDTLRQKMIPECTLPGIFGVAQMHSSKIYFDYEIGQLPLSVLIDPGGAILWKGPPEGGLLDLLNE